MADNQTELLDFTGRHERERQPQRHTIADGIWSREFRWGKTGFEGPLFVAGTPGFDFAHGSVLMVQPAWSGNNELYVQRDMAQIATVSAGELLEPGEIVLRQGESYATPWIMVTAPTPVLMVPPPACISGSARYLRIRAANRWCSTCGKA